MRRTLKVLVSLISNCHLIAYDLKQSSGTSRYFYAISPDNGNLIAFNIRPTLGSKFSRSSAGEGRGGGGAILKVTL